MLTYLITVGLFCSAMLLTLKNYCRPIVPNGPCFVCSSTEEDPETQSIKEVHYGPDQEPRVVQEVSYIPLIGIHIKYVYSCGRGRVVG